MNNIYVLGSINMDLVISTTYLPKKGETINGSNFFLNSGGKGANQAVAAAKQNVKTFLIGNIGNDVFGNDLIKILCNYNVDITHIQKCNDTSTGVAMIIIENNDNRIILDTGANYKITNEQIDNALLSAQKHDIFITQLENNLDAVIYGLSEAKKKEMITIFNPAPAKNLPNEIYNYVDYLIINETECETLSSLYPKDEETIKEIYFKFQIKNLIITLGSKGSIYVKDDNIHYIQPNKINAIDTTSAGDTYIGVFASELLKNKNEIEALNYASIASSLTCLKEGAQQSIPNKDEIIKYIKDYNILIK